MLVVGLLADAFRPPLVSLGRDVVGRAWFPTLELAVQFRRPPRVAAAEAAPGLGTGWLTFIYTTQCLMDGLHEVDAILWDEEGHVVALARCGPMRHGWFGASAY
jgi:hypothetical protein